MSILGWLLNKKLLSPEQAAIALHLNALAGLDEHRYSPLSSQDNNSLNTQIYLTRAAITILSLHIQELEAVQSDRATQTLIAFEQCVYSGQDDEAGVALIGEVKYPMASVHKLRTLPATTANADTARQVMPWAEEWLKRIPDGDQIMEKIGKLRVILLVGRLVSDANAIDALVAEVLNGR